MGDNKDKKSKRKQKLKDKIFGKAQEIVTEVVTGVEGGPTNREILIAKHKTLSREISQVKEELVLIQTILYELADEYDTSKGDCPCCRYGDLKRMVEHAILKYSGASISLDAQGGSTRSCRSSTSSDESRPLLGTTGSTSRLLQSCRRLADSENRIMRMEKKYKEMSEQDLQHGILFLTKEETSLSVTADVEKKKLNRLASQYRKVNDQCCLRRYSYLKKVIKEAIIEYHDEFGPSVDV